MKENIKLISTISNIEYPFSRTQETAENGEPLEVFLPEINKVRILQGEFIWQRFADFLPVKVQKDLSLKEGNTPLEQAEGDLQHFCGIEKLFFKNETLNPTGSFKDRGSLLITAMCREMGEADTATISTGNMGISISAYGKKAGIKVIVFIPHNTPDDKIQLMSQYDPEIFKVHASDYSEMKKTILSLAAELKLRIVSGNGPLRVEGYKLTAFELFEQMQGKVPDFIAVPTSACGHIRGIFKGYRELLAARLIERLPKMIIIQAENNSPIVSAIKQGKREIIPFRNFQTIAHAITSGEPYGGNELILKAGKFSWLAESVSEQEILDSQRMLKESGFLVEPASATVLSAVRKLRKAGKIGDDEKVILMLTGSGRKSIIKNLESKTKLISCDLKDVHSKLKKLSL
jgi:threonine synthase